MANSLSKKSELCYTISDRKRRNLRNRKSKEWTKENPQREGLYALKKIAVINDISGFGRCSMTAALPVISALGAEACPLPTAVLSNQTGYDSFFCDDFTNRLPAYIDEWKKLSVHFDGILTGFLMSEMQVELILEFLKEFKTQDTLYICDPVMADDGRIYSTYSDALCNKMKELASMADIITPNLTELCILSGTDYDALIAHSAEEDYVLRIEAIAKSLLNETLQTVIVTGVCRENSICNIAVTENGATVTQSKRFGGSYSGTGDLLSAVLSGMLVEGYTAQEAVQTAATFLAASIEDSFLEGNDRNDGVNFQKYLYMLTEKKGK